ncbi:hypothetical protein LF1_25090 [Rubripirellula obstinata]|uniref:DUF1573 domain-containing protein n=2 Tax=Rubripirellula obstinata TaxID=406547 RepID=A0A5B1CIA7_9BACT|nr:hypothetical protein LF1_25090 [Rubripirellula obstinata]
MRLQIKLGLVAVGIGFLFLAGIGLASITSFGPWGVPHSKRADYESRLVAIKQRNTKIDHYETRSRPIRHLPIQSRNLGFISAGESLTAVFDVENVGRENLSIIKQHSPSDLEVKIQPPELRPGETAKVKLQWRLNESQVDVETGRESTTITRRARFATNDPIDPTFELKLEAKLRQKLLYPSKIQFKPSQVAEPVGKDFVVSSQTLTDLDIDSISCDAPGFIVEHSKVTDLAQLEEPSTVSASRVTFQFTPLDYGDFSWPLTAKIVNDDRSIEKIAIELTGRVRSPISFYHPDMHRKQGLSLGTLSADTEHTFHVQVRLRHETHRRLEVLDQFPPELDVVMSPQASRGIYKLTIVARKGCSTTEFNRVDRRGFIKVGDPEDPAFFRWLPIYGAIVNIAD